MSGRGRQGDERVVVFEEQRGHLFGIAYRMLGEVSAAEDMVQETFLRWGDADRATIANPGGWLTTACTRLCLDRLRSARHRREEYVGPWLPEPLLTTEPDPAEPLELAESLSMAFLVVLERLSPAERVAWVLHDVFDYPFTAVAEVLDRSPEAARQLASRARRSVRAHRPRLEDDAARAGEVAEAFLRACAGGELTSLLELLAPDVVFRADSGGAVPSARRPVIGAESVARLLLGLVRKAPRGAELRPVAVNGRPGLAGVVGGRLEVVFALEITGGRVGAVHAIRNPAKLAAAAARLGLGVARPRAPR